jgi:WD40 repeat protein
MQVQLIRTYPAHQSAIQTLITASGGKYLISGGDSGDSPALKVWSLNSDEATGALRGHNAPPTALATFPDGDFVASGAANGELKLWNAATHEIVRSLDGHEAAITALIITSDGRRIISGSADTTVRIWDSLTGQLLHTFNGQSTPVQALTLTPDNNHVIIGERSSNEGSVFRVHDVSSGTLLEDFPGQHYGVNSLAFNASQQTVISGSTEGDVVIRAWPSGDVQRTIETHYGSAVTAIMPNHSYAVIGTQRPLLTLWNLDSGTHIHTLEEPSSRVTSLAVTPDNRLILAGCDDGILNVYQLQV